LILLLIVKSQSQKIAAFGSSYREHGQTLKRVAAQKSVGELAFFVAGIAAQLAW